MTGTEMIKTKILEDARKRASEAEEQARREAQEILDKAASEAGQKRAEILKKADSDSQEIYRRLLSTAALEGRKELLRAKQDMIEATFQRALEKVANLPDLEYERLMEDMVVKAATGGGDELLLTTKDAQRLGNEFLNKVNKRLQTAGMNGNIVLSKDNIRASGGFILRSGDIEINSTLEIVSEMLRPELENEVVKILFGT